MEHRSKIKEETGGSPGHVLLREISRLRLRAVTPSLATRPLPLNHMDQMLGLPPR